LKVLIVSENQSDSQTLRKVVRNILSKSIIVTAVNKSQAIEIICNDGPFAFYIVDADIKTFKIEDVINSFIELSGSKPILYTGHQINFNAHITQELFEDSEYNQYIPKPFGEDTFRSDLEERINGIMEGVSSENRESSIEQIEPNDFIKMRLRGFYLFDQFPYDIYLEITPTRYLKLLPAHTKYGHSFLASYAKKNVKFLHVKKDDQLQYLEGEIGRFLEVFKTKKDLSSDPFTLLLRSITIMHQYLQAIGISPKAILLMDSIVECIINVQRKHQNIQSLLESYPFYYEGISSKSLLTAFISIYISKNLDWDSNTTKAKLIVSSVLQDYSLSDEAMSKITSLKDPYLKKVSKEALEEFKNHPIKSSLMAAQFTKYTDIDSIVVNHHEFPSRKGFPHQPVNGMLSRLNHVFNMSQYVASKIDGAKITDTPMQKIILGMKKDFNLGNAKDIYETMKKTIL